MDTNPEEKRIGAEFVVPDENAESTVVLEEPKISTHLSERRSRLIERQIDLAKLQEETIQFIRENPDVDIGQLYADITSAEVSFKLTDDEKAITLGVLKEYEKRHESVKKLREKFPSDEELFQGLFGFKPRGKILIVDRPMIFHIRCFNTKDYASLFGGAYIKKREPTEEDIKDALKTQGVHMGIISAHGYEVDITVEKIKNNNIDDETLLHEEQHAIHSLFFKGMVGHPKLEKFLKATSREEQVATISNYMRLVRVTAEEKAKNEILAFFKDGTDPESTFRFITEEVKDGSYDYVSKEKRYFKSGWFLTTLKQIGFAGEFNKKTKGGEENLETTLDKLIERIFDIEYKEVLQEAIVACNSLKFAGFSKERAVALLTHQPLRKWKRIVSRFPSVY